MYYYYYINIHILYAYTYVLVGSERERERSPIRETESDRENVRGEKNQTNNSLCTYLQYIVKARLRLISKRAGNATVDDSTHTRHHAFFLVSSSSSATMACRGCSHRASVGSPDTSAASVMWGLPSCGCGMLENGPQDLLGGFDSLL